ncbi:MAG: ABC transporter ATP-binding protein [Desulfobacterota bacterium]|nr:ABC transporter ATP-binding protein [Thermodesulfobacteriota bacterium]
MVQVRVENLWKRFGNTEALKNVSLNFASGGLTAILGPSGCGKTTLLRGIAGFTPLDRGRVFFDEDEVTGLPPQKRGTAMVFQNYALWPHMTVFENVAYGLRLLKLGETEIRRRVREVLEMVEIANLSEVETRKPGALSGGQQQRVALARALVVRPKVLLMDEPLSNLDAKVRQRLRAEVRRIQKQVGITAIYVTHDQEEALAMADTIVLMNQGEVVQVGTPQTVYLKPSTAFAAEFLGVSNQIGGEVSGGFLRVGNQAIPFQTGLQGRVTVIFRATDGWIADEAETSNPDHIVLSGQLEESLFLGAYYRHYVRVGDGVVMVDSPDPRRPGAVYLVLSKGKIQVYSAS